MSDFEETLSDREKRFYEALKHFKRHPSKDVILFPGDPDLCRGNGAYTGYPYCCDECDFRTDCYPESRTEEEILRDCAAYDRAMAEHQKDPRTHSHEDVKRLLGKHIRICRVRCRRCGDLLEYIHKSKTETPHMLLVCTCKAIIVDPDPISTRVIGNDEDYEELHDYWDD